MKLAAYLYGLLCVSAAIALGAYFVTVYILQTFINHLPDSIAKPVMHLFLSIPFLLAATYLIRGIVLVRRAGIPTSFSGWRYILTALGFGILILGATPSIISLWASPASGGMSGVPLALGFIFSLVFVLPSMTTPRKDDGLR
jgi:hypothetical protein